jgi:hypothetical protein
VLDVRVYRTAFLPALVALFVAAFALADRPAPASSPLTADAFTKARAFGSATDPARNSLLGLASAFPDRAAGSSGDTGLAQRVADVLGAPDEAHGRPAYQVRRIVTPGRTATGPGELVTIVGTRPGLSSRRIVVLANRDSLDRPGLADLSGTAALLEIARIYKTRELRRTLVLVSTSGATTGFAGARAWARDAAGGPVDAVIVLGDLAGAKIRKPWVVGWPDAAKPTPLGLERTLGAAVRAETGSEPGGPHAVGQWARRALPVTVSAQGPIGAAGLPAVLLSESGERGPAPGEPVLPGRLEAFGRAALRAVNAIDAVGPMDQPAFDNRTHGIVTLRNVLPDWAVRLLVGTLLLPVLLVAFDAFFRARRRRVAVLPWLGWLAAAAVPVVVAWLWLRLLGASGILAAPDGPVPPRAFPLERGGAAAMVSAALAGALLGWLALALARRALPTGGAGAEGLAVATGLLACALAAVVWVPNPYAAGVLVPAAHLWLFAAGGWRGAVAAAALVGGLLAPVLVLAHLGLALHLGPLGLLWGASLAAAAGAGLWSMLVVAALAAALAGLLRVLVARRAADRASGGDVKSTIQTRGPLSYAGPGSLGGTESALRR